MGDWSSPLYISSQVFVIIAYIFYAITFFVKNKSSLLGLFILGNLMQGISFGLLTAWVGLGMCIVAIGRDGSNYIMNRRRLEQDRKKLKRTDIYLLFFWIIVLTLVTVFTQDGILSWFAFFPTLLFTWSLWQKNVGIYRISGIIAHGFWVIYNIYVQNFFGVVFSSVLLSVAVVGCFLLLKKAIRQPKRSDKITVEHGC